MGVGEQGGGFRATGSRLPLHPAATWRHCWVVRLQSQPRGDWCWDGDLVNPGLKQGCTDSKISTHFTCPCLTLLELLLQNTPDWAAEIYFLIVLKAEHPRSRCYQCWFPVSLFLDCKGLPLLSSHGFPSVHSGEGRGRGGLDVSPFSFKDTSPTELEFHHHDINHLLKGPISKSVGSWGFNTGTEGGEKIQFSLEVKLLILKAWHFRGWDYILCNKIIRLFKNIYLFIWLLTSWVMWLSCPVTCRILVPQAEIEPRSPALHGRS